MVPSCVRVCVRVFASERKRERETERERERESSCVGSARISVDVGDIRRENPKLPCLRRRRAFS